jgi:glycerol-3-phosphate acyltransferase PlsY
MMHDVLGWERAWPWLAFAFFGGYVFGSIPFGVIIAQLRGLGDLRKVGSGNIGATNVLRTGDRWGAALTLLLDGAKGAFAVSTFSVWGPLPSMLAGLGAFLGHLFPAWLKFRGGKGVATWLGVMLALHWPTGLLCCAVWLAVAYLTRYSSLSALISAVTAPLWLMLFSQWGYVLLAALMAAMLLLTHAKNIVRLIRGEESKIRLGRT